ncbi:late embryogenesis abundant protein At1g64065-like [Salvia hispanica]|uniref:late embryogenesis abundant protein At1g64065-like n=1 Tax=Salvia hispanica TaxID=49212 RepID=UPI0020097CE2|nr:late embryogenesis abundant protein At1g64065-like [Salvia hispanica]
MTDKYQPEVQQGYPLAPATVVPRSDEEYGRYSSQSEAEMKKKKRMKCIAYIAIFAVFQVAVILIFSLTVMRVRTPKVRLENIVITSSPTSSDLRLSARITVKNTNFGRYKYESTLASIRSGNGGGPVAEFAIEEARARARSTKKVNFVADLGSSGTGNASGTMDFVVEARMRGKVELMRVIKRKKTAEMACNFTVVLANNGVQNLTCK